MRGLHLARLLLGLLVVVQVHCLEAPQLAGDSFVHVAKTAGQDVVLRCKPKKGTKLDVVSVKWLKNGNLINATARSPLSYVQRHFRLMLPTASPTDEGNYTCLVKTSRGSAQRTLRLTVEERHGLKPPTIKHGLPSNLTLYVGQNGSLNCPLEDFDIGTDTYPNIKWIKAIDKDDDTNDNFVVLQSCGLSGHCTVHRKDEHNSLDTMEYWIINANLSDTGAYSCIASNHFGSDVSTAYVQVLPPPVIPQFFTSDNPTNLMAVVGVGSFVGGLVICVSAATFFYHRQKRERRAKKRAQKHLRTAVYLWTKLVLVHRSDNDENNNNNDQPLLPPKVTVERRSRIFSASTETTSPMSTETEYEFVADPKWELPRSALTMGPKIGQGEFGMVVKAWLRDGRFTSDVDKRQSVMNNSGDETKATLLEKSNRNDDIEPIIVAVKMLKNGHSEQDVIDLVQEAEIMKKIGKHRNIINLLGVISLPAGLPFLLVVEYAELGNLKSVLLRQRELLQQELGPEQQHWDTTSSSIDSDGYEVPLSPKNAPSTTDTSLKFPKMDHVEMANVGRQVAMGMAYLSSRKCVHRDLAARNVLVAEGFVYKIADFGMARDVHSNDYYRKNTSGRLPIKWMAPESVFDRVCTTHSDVYSFGVLLWEVASMGELPFNDLSVSLFFEYLGQGRTLQRPQNCPQNIFEVMQDCWAFQPINRPTWKQLVNRLTFVKEHLENNPQEERNSCSVPERG